jgi:hypothetical protein
MKIERTAACLAAALVVAGLACAQATANPLLSGYGGPGQGSQAVLGAALLNVPAGATSQSGGSTSGDQASSGSAGEGVPAHSGARHGSAVEGSGGSRANRRTQRPSASRRTPSESGQSIAIAADAASAGAPTLGVTGPDLLLTVGVLAALAIIWGGTRRTARRRDG